MKCTGSRICICDGCAPSLWSDDKAAPPKSARQHARERGALDGADAQALEHAVTITERERDDALAKLAEAREVNRKLHRRAQAAEGSLSDLDWALDYYRLRPRNTQWQGYGEIDVARRIRDAESKLAEARALLERIGDGEHEYAYDDVRAWLAANPGTEAKR